MRVGVKLAGFAVVLAAAFGAGATLGAALPEIRVGSGGHAPDDTGPSTSTTLHEGVHR